MSSAFDDVEDDVEEEACSESDDDCAWCEEEENDDENSCVSAGRCSFSLSLVFLAIFIPVLFVPVLLVGHKRKSLPDAAHKAAKKQRISAKVVCALSLLAC